MRLVFRDFGVTCRPLGGAHRWQGEHFGSNMSRIKGCELALSNLLSCQIPNGSNELEAFQDKKRDLMDGVGSTLGFG